MQHSTQEEEKGFPGGSEVKKPPASAGDTRSVLGLGRFPGEENQSHGQRRLEGYSPRRHKETDMTDYAGPSQIARVVSLS